MDQELFEPDLQSDQEIPSGPRASTPVVLLLLVGVAGVFSYLGSYAVVNALIAADIVAPIAPESDPRLHWMVYGFAGQLALFLFVAGVFRWMSSRQFRRIDAMAE